jgi:hypothetical protein
MMEIISSWGTTGKIFEYGCVDNARSCGYSQTKWKIAQGRSALYTTRIAGDSSTSDMFQTALHRGE